MTSKSHWEGVYDQKAYTEVSWFQTRAEVSLRLIERARIPRTAAIIDVGAGASRLVDDLLGSDYRNLTVLDLSGAALRAAKARLGPRAERALWLEADISDAPLAEHAYDLWHDRAVFHFLIRPEERAAYVQALKRAVKPGGQVILATFAEDGPTRCSGLPVMRYSPERLQAELGGSIAILEHEEESHRTPGGATQHFLYCLCRKTGS